MKKIATFLPVQDEMLEDAPQLQSYINNRLTLFIRLTEDTALLRGAGTAPDLQGIVGRTGVNTLGTGGSAARSRSSTYSRRRTESAARRS